MNKETNFAYCSKKLCFSVFMEEGHMFASLLISDKQPKFADYKLISDTMGEGGTMLK